MTRMQQWIGIAALALGIGLVTAQAAKPAAGHKLYTAKCAGCHGSSGGGVSFMGPKTNLLTPAAKKKTNAQIAAIIRKGASPMPAYNSLSPAQIRALVAYVRALQHK